MRYVRRERVEELIRESVPGEERKRMLAGGSPSEPAAAAVLSELDGLWHVSFLRFYEPGGDEAPPAAPDVPPTPEGVAVVYRKTFEDPLEAAMDYGQFFHALLEEGSGEPLFGLEQIRKKIEDARVDSLFERLYSDPELREHPDYRQDLMREIEELIPDEGAREGYHSLYRFRHGVPEGD